MRPLVKAGCLAALSACSGEAAVPGSAPPPPLGSGIERAGLDSTVRPQDDLYRAVNGTWLARTPIPPDKPAYGAFTQLSEEAEVQLRAIVEELAAKPDKPAGSIEQKVGDYYAAFMDEARAEALGLEPIAADFARVEALRDRKEIPLLLAELARKGVDGPLTPYVHQDAKDATRYAGDFWQSGLSLPDRDYYLADAEKLATIREKFREHLERMFRLASQPAPARQARAVLALETRLARAHWDKVDNRDPVKVYNAFRPARLRSVAAGIDWPAYLEAVGYGALPEVLISQPSYVRGLGRLLREIPLEDWKSYLKWQILTARAPLLSRAVVDEDFDFFHRILNGQPENRPRWKRGVAAVEGALGEAVGQIYVRRHFPPENKARMEALVKQLIVAYGIAIDSLDWMSPETREAARAKLAKFTYKIGYPDKWRDYSRLEVRPGDAVGNAERAAAFEYDRNIAKLGKPIDRDEWLLSPQTVNAYYNPERNEIVFPAAILRPPFFDMAADDAANYGAIGSVIGHEISHGFDDGGSKYDGDGNLRMWWKDEDRRKFEERGARLAAQYDGYEPVPGHTVNGKFTLGENIADLGGVTIAHQAYRLSLDGREPPVIDGLGGDQRVFMGWAQVWRTNMRPEYLLNELTSDPHAPAEYRVNGVVTNVPAFYRAFGLKQTDQLYTAPEKRITIW